MKRGQFLGGGAALSVLSTGSPAWTNVRTQLLWIKNVGYAGFWIADARGLFARQALGATFLAGGPGLGSVESIVASGHADVGVDELHRIVRANLRGGDFVVFGSIYQRPIGGLLSLAKNPVRSAADIVGKRIGIPPGGREDVDAILALNHLPQAYTEVPVGPSLRPLIRGDCDAYLGYLTTQPLQLAAERIPYVAAPLDALGFSDYSSALFCTRRYAERNRETLVRYVRAAAAGWTINRRDPELGALLAANRYGAALRLDVRQQVAQNEAQIPLVGSEHARPGRRLLEISKAAVSGGVYATLRAMGTRELPNVDRLIDATVYRDALGTG
jgi:ABC-type nitrate/sulfonate/bicarbonate transport system substrate-binding protein